MKQIINHGFKATNSRIGGRLALFRRKTERDAFLADKTVARLWDAVEKS